jgi:hypothetical protein
MNETVRPADLVEEFIRLRSEREAVEKGFEVKIAELYGNRMEEIKNILLDTLNAMGVESLAGKTGTAFKATQISVTTADMREFRRHVIGGEQWDLVDWRPNKTAINDLVAENQPLPPGINRSVFQTVNIRRKS